MARRLISPDKLPEYGILIGNKHRQRLEDKGLFPKRVHPTAKTHAYVEDEILAHNESCIRLRDAALTPQAA
jgi:hypothetical protein